MGRLAGKVALITGAGQGVGLGIAQAFAEAGAAIVITGRDAGKLEAALPDLERRGARALACPGDAARKESAERAVQAAIDAFGGLDIVVNNAQARRSGVPVEDILAEDLDLAFGSGPYATLFHMQAAFPHLKEAGGSIINFGSKMGLMPMEGVASYAAAKEAIRGLSRAAAREWGRYRIRVNVLNPASLSPGAQAYFQSRPEEYERLRQDLALGYFGDAETDIGAAALFLASDDSRYVTGQTINVDGGQVML
jgi:NAD(P)-dependent dehydrogenase (short-subunit alcohol dehydrogenase family)